MTYYGKLSVGAQFSRNSDCSSPEPELHKAEYSCAPNAGVYYKDLPVAAVGTTIELGHYTTVIGFIVINKATAAADTLAVEWVDSVSTASNQVTLPANGGQILVMSPAVASDLALTPSSGAVVVDVYLLTT